MVKKSWLMGPRTSSILPIDVYSVLSQKRIPKTASSGQTRPEVPYLVLEVHRCVEVRDLGVYALAHHLAFACVHKLTHLQDCCWGTEVALSIASTTSTAYAWLVAILLWSLD